MAKKTTLVLGTALAALLVAGLALAGPYGHGDGPGMGRIYAQLSPEKQALVDKVMDQHQAKSHDLREKMWAKRTELDALVRSGKAEKKDIQSLVQEMTRLRSEMHTEREALRAELTKETGIEPPRRGLGPGFGERAHGFGPGNGPGAGRCGFGERPCGY
ncbi:MAG: periplasmic heavy metal sensor [Desulfovibrionaceae bacterium]|nr:periplasmic heavy metal sensor [Desulfovibrionaceae bacterium]